MQRCDLPPASRHQPERALTVPVPHGCSHQVIPRALRATRRSVGKPPATPRVAVLPPHVLHRPLEIPAEQHVDQVTAPALLVVAPELKKRPGALRSGAKISPRSRRRSHARAFFPNLTGGSKASSLSFQVSLMHPPLRVVPSGRARDIAKAQPSGSVGGIVGNSSRGRRRSRFSCRKLTSLLARYQEDAVTTLLVMPGCCILPTWRLP